MITVKNGKFSSCSKNAPLNNKITHLHHQSTTNTSISVMQRGWSPQIYAPPAQSVIKPSPILDDLCLTCCCRFLQVSSWLHTRERTLTITDDVPVSRHLTVLSYNSRYHLNIRNLSTTDTRHEHKYNLGLSLSDIKTLDYCLLIHIYLFHEYSNVVIFLVHYLWRIFPIDGKSAIGRGFVCLSVSPHVSSSFNDIDSWFFALTLSAQPHLVNVGECLVLV